MEPEMWNQAEDLFGRGLEASADEREHLLANAPPDIAAAVRDLWRQHAEAGSFLDRPAAVPECPRQFADGQILGGRFKIVGFIGAGGMGEVYRAHDERLGRTVAIKALHARLTADADSRSRFEREARAVCSLNHPRICSLHDVAWDGSTPLLVMEHLSGETLAERLTRGRLTLDELLAVGEGIADALAYAHQHGVVHRDLKPGNIMLTEHGPKLLDFGIAKRVIPQGVRADTATTVTQTAAGMIVGSVAYMSPEQAESRLTDHRADVFSFGAVLYEMATGRRAFHGDTHASTLAAVLKGEPVPLRTLAPASPAALDRIVRRCLRKNRDERYPEMVAVRVGLLALTKPSARWRWVAAACALLAVAVAVALWPRPATNVEIALPKPVQLTVDLGDTGDPSLSPDGKWLAYVSDRGNTGQYGLWVQRLDGTEGRKVIECTFLGDPVFTPDGQTIIYACRDTPDPQQRDLYSINVDGTERKLVLKDGYWPSISPNGKYVAFLSRKTRRHAVLPLAGGEPIPLRPENYYGLGRAIWSPDSERLMIVNWRYSMEQGSRFWVASRDGSEAVETPLFDVLENAGYERGRQGSMLYSWTPTHIYLSFSAGGSRDVWRVPFDAQRGMPLGQATRITASTGAWNGIVQHGKLVFDASAFQSNLFALRLASDGRSVAAEPRQLTFDSTVNFLPMLSLDGRRVSYISQRARYHQLFVVDVASGRSLSITELPRSSRSMPFYCISPDGEHVAWADQGNVYRSRTDSPTRERVCSDCGYPLVWLPDGSGLLLRDKKARDTLFLYEFSSGRRRAILRARDHNLGQVSVSSDGGWLAFQAVQGVSMEGFIAPLGGALKEDMSEWIPVSKGINLTNFIWSARGDLLYAVDRGRRIVAIPLNRGTKYPSGPPVPVHELPKDSKQYIHRIAAADGLIVAYMESSHRNIWIQDLPK